jgi:hypothetical protein
LRYDRCNNGLQTPTGVRYICPSGTVCIDAPGTDGIGGTVVVSSTGVPAVNTRDTAPSGPCIATPSCSEVGLRGFGIKGMSNICVKNF